ncbi:unnamed protein product, partial [Laminaria digitata]
AIDHIRTGLDYSDLAVVAERGSFSTTERVKALVKDLSSRSDAQLVTLRDGLVLGRSSILYGTTKGPTLNDMEPFHDTASKFLQEVQATLDNGGLWNCPSSHLSEEMLSPRTLTKFPLKRKRRQWLRESETIVNMEHSLLFCAPPNTGSLQFRMLAKRMEGVDHWKVTNDRSLLFDAVASELPLLDLDNMRLMEDIFKDNGSGWIKIGVVRDPVTRLLSAYLDLVQAWPSASTDLPFNGYQQRQPHRGLRVGEDGEWFDAIRRHRSITEGEAEQELPGAGEPLRPRTRGEELEGGGLRGRGDAPRGLQDEAAPAVPTFDELLDSLASDIWSAPSAFRPAASLCGMWQSPFDTIIPFESLQRTSTKVLKSLPGDIWRSFGESGWGPEGKHAFMEFDYGTVARHDDREINAGHGGEAAEEAQQTSGSPIASPRARDLFSDGSCAWTDYYADHAILDKVGRLYSADFGLFGWYDLDEWRERLQACLLKERE